MGQESKLLHVLRISLSKLAESKDQTALVSEIGNWNSLTPHQVAAIFRGSGIKSRGVTKLGQRSQGFSRLELQGLLTDLQNGVVEQSEAPTRDWGCTDCFERFESRERAPACPNCAGINTKIAAPSRAPAFKSQNTTFRDEMVQGMCDDYHLTDYRSADHMPGASQASPAIATPQGDINSAPVSQRGADIGAAIGRAAPGTMTLNLKQGLGEAKAVPKGLFTMREHIETMSGGTMTLPPRRPTQIVARTGRTLPPV